MISSALFLLLSATAQTSFALPQATSTPIPQYENITIYANDNRIQYLPTCPSKHFSTCRGSWYKLPGEQFSNGEAMTAAGPSEIFGGLDPYLTFSFKGTAMYMYQWVNSTTARQTRFTDVKDTVWLDLTADYPPDPANPGELRLVLAWKMENLDPKTSRTIGLQQQPDASGIRKQVIIDRIVITRPVGVEDDFADKNDRSQGAKIGGAVVGSILGVLIIFGITFCLIRRRRAIKAAAQKHNWEGTNGAVTQKLADPSAEIVQSERLAREGRLEEQKNTKGSPPMPTLPLIT